MLSHVLSNSVYFKNLSPLVTEAHIRDFLLPHLPSKDEIRKIEFHSFPNSLQRFCQIDFASSNGVTATTALNGHSLLGVPVVATVIDPLSQGLPVAPIASGSLSSGPTYNGLTSSRLSMNPLDTTSSFLTALPRTPALHFRETEDHQLHRTIQVTNLPLSWDLDHLIVLLTAHVKQLQRLALEVTDKKLIHGLVPETGLRDRIALIEFKTSEMAEFTRKLPAFARFIDGKELSISQAKTTVSPREPDNVSFDLPPSAPVPVAYQQLNKLKLQEKVARARDLAQHILAPIVDKFKTRGKDSDEKKDSIMASSTSTKFNLEERPAARTKYYSASDSIMSKGHSENKRDFHTDAAKDRQKKKPTRLPSRTRHRLSNNTQKPSIQSASDFKSSLDRYLSNDTSACHNVAKKVKKLENCSPQQENKDNHETNEKNIGLHLQHNFCNGPKYLVETSVNYTNDGKQSVLHSTTAKSDSKSVKKKKNSLDELSKKLVLDQNIILDTTTKMSPTRKIKSCMSTFECSSDSSESVYSRKAQSLKRTKTSLHKSIEKELVLKATSYKKKNKTDEQSRTSSKVFDEKECASCLDNSALVCHRDTAVSRQNPLVDVPVVTTHTFDSVEEKTSAYKPRDFDNENRINDRMRELKEELRRTYDVDIQSCFTLAPSGLKKLDDNIVTSKPTDSCESCSSCCGII